MSIKTEKNFAYCEIRNAKKIDAEKIQKILAKYAEDNLLLPRPIEDIRKNISSFKVAFKNGSLIGCCAAKNYGNKLFEIRSLAVLRRHNGKGVGSELVKKWIQSLKKTKKAKRIFALTYRPALFARLGFNIVSKELFPEKIWTDCAVCSKKEKCDETAVLIQL